MVTLASPVRILSAVVALTAPLALSGCGDGGGLARTFGLSRDAPDEFAVTTQAPLSMPPDFNLRPPRPGVLRPQQRSEREQAEEALVPQLALSGPQSGAPTRGQAALLQESGPAVSPGIRQQIDQDANLEAANASFLDRVLTWRKTDTRNIEVDAARENQRLRQATALGQPSTTGITPTIAPRRESWFQRLFGWF
jgi:hypothetical protein